MYNFKNIGNKSFVFTNSIYTYDYNTRDLMKPGKQLCYIFFWLNNKPAILL